MLRPALLLLMVGKSAGYHYHRSVLERIRRQRRERASSVSAKPSPVDDPFGDPFASDNPFNETAPSGGTKESRYEARLLKQAAKAERSRLHSIILEAGGLKTNNALREEYSGIPNTFKRRDGLLGDEVADYLNTYYQEFGIQNERDLIDYLAA